LSAGNIYLDSPEIDVSPGNDWSQVRVWNNRDGHLGGRTYKVRGFIAPMRIASL
ncbi:MAG: CHAP domain-containing protein, partial [Proteobacteria bacterium]|nr:CHAP domain-containing protein [Pseudomonadota bacterium]